MIRTLWERLVDAAIWCLSAILMVAATVLAWIILSPDAINDFWSRCVRKRRKSPYRGCYPHGGGPGEAGNGKGGSCEG